MKTTCSEVFFAAKNTLEDHQSQTGDRIRRYEVKDVVEFYAQRVDLTEAEKRELTQRLWGIMR